MGLTDRYRINEPTVIHQTIGGETVIIHLASGLYYSLDGSGADIWEQLSSGRTPAAVAGAFSVEPGSGRDAIAAEVDTFVQRLLDEDLLVPAGTSGSNGAHPAGAAAIALGDPPAAPAEPAAAEPAAAEPAAAEPTTFRSPHLSRYDDLQDLLLLDPIHAVDETGWPDRPRAGAGSEH